MSSEPKYNLENLLAQIGNANRFQLIMVICNRTPVAFVAWTMVEMSLLKAEPQWCCIPKDLNTTSVHYCYHGNQSFGRECHLDNAQCSRRLFEEGVHSIVNEWDLVCDGKWKASFSISVQMAGVLIGTTLTGVMANYLGRKKTFFISLATLMIFSFITGFSPSWEIFLVFRFLLGISCGMYYVVAMPYVMEFLSPSQRSTPALIPIIQVALMIMCLCTWLLQDWRLVHWLTAALIFPMLSFWLFSVCFCGLGISFGVSTLGLNMYLNFFLLAAVSFPFSLSGPVLLSRIGRRPLGIALTTVAMLCALSSVIVFFKVSDKDDVALVTTILCLIANGCVGIVWGLQIIITNESYPTVLRTLGYAASNVAGRVGAILAPFAFDFSERLVFSYILLGGMMGLCAFLIFLLKETKDLALQDTMQEAEISVERSKSTRKRPLLATDSGRNEKNKYGIR